MSKSNKKKISNHLYVCDFETTTSVISSSDTSIYIAGLYNINTKSVYYFYDTKEVLDGLEKLPKGSLVYFHNLTFDGEFILHILLSSGYVDYNNFDMNDLESRREFFSYSKYFKIYQSTDGRIYKISLHIVVKHNDTKFLKRIEIRCSLNILNLSVKKLGETLEMDVKKGELDYDKYYVGMDGLKDDEELHSYLFNDLVIVAKAIIEFWDKITEKGVVKSNFGLTSSAISFKQFSNYLKVNSYERPEWLIDFQLNTLSKLESKNVPLIKNPSNYNKLFGWIINGWTVEEHSRITTFFYRGGYTIGNLGYIDEWVKCENGESYDVNSLYPYVMLSKKIPYGAKLSKKQVDEYNINDYYTFYEIEITKIKPKKEKYIPLIKNTFTSALRKKYNQHNHYIKEWKSDDIFDFIFQGVLKEELDFWLEFYELDYKITKTFFSAKTGCLMDYIKTVKKEKTEAKTPSDRAIAKLKQNSLYGKFGEKCNKESFYYTKTKPRNIIDLEYGNGYYRRSIENDVVEGNLKHPLVACVITTFARLELQRTIFDNLDNFLYCDTDSIWLKNINGLKLKVDEVKYGYWKKEHSYKEFKWIRPKCYGYINNENKASFKVSGLPGAGLKKITRDTFKGGLQLSGAKRMKQRVKGGILLLETDFKIKKIFIKEGDDDE